MKAFFVDHPTALTAAVTAIKLAMRDLPSPPSLAAAAVPTAAAATSALSEAAELSLDEDESTFPVEDAASVGGSTVPLAGNVGV